MQKRILGRTGWKFSAIGFGAIKLPQLNQKESDSLLNRAIDLGVNFVDTADCYGDSEEKIGRALSRRRKEFYLSTKIDERDGPGVLKKLERCLRRLKTDWIDLVLFHDVRGPEYERIFEMGGLEVLEKAREQGKIAQIGISIHQSISMMKKAVDSGVFSVLMVAYSAIDEDRLAADLIPMVHKKGVGVIAMKPLAGGKLAESLRGWDRQYFKGESPAQISLRYILTNPHVTCAIPGMTNTKELEENIKVAEHPRDLTLEETGLFMNWVGEAGKGFCRNCGYCLPCPEEIPIPDIFRFEGYYERYGMKRWAKEQYHLLPVNAGVCSACEECIPRCPYGVNIPQRIREAHQILGVS
jgi:predicted aldo/keto reductase-like oxidoreductase